MSYKHAYEENWSFATPIAVGTGTTTLVAAPTGGRRIAVQVLTICVTTAAAQTFDVSDSSGTVKLFTAPASLAVGTYGMDGGPLGVLVTANEALQYIPAAAGVGLTISGFGHIRDV